MDRNDPSQATVSKDPGKRAFSTRVSKIFDFATESAASCRERIRVFQFKSGGPNISRCFAGFRGLNMKKWIINAQAVIILMIALCCAVLVGYWKEYMGKCHHEKDRHSSKHHRE